MYSTTTLVKNSRLNGQLIGTHQQLDKAARRCLTKHLPKHWYFPVSREILGFEGMRGPDGLKRKSPDDDDPSHMYDEDLLEQIAGHYHNLVQALKDHNHVRAAFEAAWLAHKTTDSLTPAHHFPLAEQKEELMSNKELVQIFGTPIKGLMHGRSMAETARNNWIYWGASGTMSKHIGYEYGVALITATLPQKAILPEFSEGDFATPLAPATIIQQGIAKIQPYEVYQEFRKDGWTTDQTLRTKNVVLPEIVRALTRVWYAAAAEAFDDEEKHG